MERKRVGPGCSMETKAEVDSLECAHPLDMSGPQRLVEEKRRKLGTARPKTRAPRL